MSISALAPEVQFVAWQDAAIITGHKDPKAARRWVRLHNDRYPETPIFTRWGACDMVSLQRALKVTKQ